MKTQKVASKLLQHSPRKVDLAWNNLQAFLSLSPNVLQRLVRHFSLCKKLPALGRGVSVCGLGRPSGDLAVLFLLGQLLFCF